MSLLGVTTVALAIATFAAPVRADDPKATLAFVNGIPGRKVDVCLNGNEIASGLGYGKAVTRAAVSTGTKKLRFRARQSGTCEGAVLAKRNLSLVAGIDLTIVATKGAPKVVTFSNAGKGEIPPLGAPSPFAFSLFRSSVGFPVSMDWVAFSPSPVTPLEPAADPVFFEGDEHLIFGSGGYIAEVRARRPEQSPTIASKREDIRLSHRHEFILVGTTPGNARFALIDRRVSQPSP